MHRLVSSVIAASLFLTPISVRGKQNQGSNSNISQSNLSEHPSSCEQVRITLNSGRKIDADSYKHLEDHVEILKKGVGQVFADKEIKRIEIRQGSCPDVVVTLKTGEKIEGYLRDRTCDSGCNCRSEIKQKTKVVNIPGSDIKHLEVKYKQPLSEKLINVALIPLYPFLAILLYIGCRNGCD